MADALDIQELPADTVVLTVGGPAAERRPLPDLAGARSVSEGEAAAIRARRASIHEKFAAEAEGQQAPAWGETSAEDVWGGASPYGDLNPEAAAAPLIDENLESVEVAIPPDAFHPTGTTILFGPPTGVSLTMRILQLLGTRQVNPNTIGVLKIMLSVRKIGDWTAPPIASLIDAQRMANKLGDVALDILSMVYGQCWPAVRVDSLPILKKNQRQ